MNVTMHQVINDISNTNNPESLLDVINSYSKSNGFHGFAYASQNNKLTHTVSPLTNYPSEWINCYNANKYYKHDPVLSFALNSEYDFVWEEIIPNLKLCDESATVMKLAQDYNIKNGLSIPIDHFKGTSFHYLCEESPDDITRNTMKLISHLANEQIQKILQAASPKKLSARESECLIWTAAGKTSEEIGLILGIATRTVNEHINNSMRKLNTTNKTQAVFKALMLKEFSFSNVPA